MLGIACLLGGGGIVHCAGFGALTRSDANEPLGFAMVAGRTTGGGNAVPTTVKTLAELKAAAQDEAPRVIRISGTIKTTDESGWPLDIKSNKTLIGADKNATIYGTPTKPMTTVLAP